MLFEASWNDLVDVIWDVEINYDLAVSRLKVRNNFSEADAKARIDSQLSSEERRRRSDQVIVNEGDLEQLKAEVEKLFHQLISKSS